MSNWNYKEWLKELDKFNNIKHSNLEYLCFSKTFNEIIGYFNYNGIYEKGIKIRGIDVIISDIQEGFYIKTGGI